MQIPTDNREVVTAYVLMSLAICSVVLMQMDIENRFWLGMTTITTLAFLASRLAREAIFGPELQAIVKDTPLWKIFGLGIGLLVIEVVLASYVSTPEWSIAIRKVFGPISLSIIFVGAEIAIFRWSTGLIRQRIAAEQA